MKRHLVKLMVMGSLLFVVQSCTKKEEAPVQNNATTDSTSTQVKQDEEVLSNDSATAATAVGVKDEEANAKASEKKEDQKLQADEKKEEKK